LIAVLIPRVADDPVAQRNLERVTKRLRQAGVRHIEVLSGRAEDAWHAAWLADQEWLWIHYPDLLLPFEMIVEEVKACLYPALKPYETYRRLSQEESNEESGTTLSLESEPLGKQFGKGAFLVKRELFLALGGLHPELFCDGDEGFEFSRRLRYFLPDIPTVEQHGSWLFRPQSPEEKELRRSSAERRRALQIKFDSDPEEYLESFPRLDRGKINRIVREQALRATSPCPPPIFEEKLPGEMWALTTYFNPEDYESKRNNFKLFREQLKLPLCVVELAFEDKPFELGEEDAELLIQIRGGDVLWQKEQLLNVGLKRLPASCDKVCWLDADVLFDNDDWAEQTAQLLTQYVVVQPFFLSVRLMPGETSCDIAELPLGSAEHEVLHGIGYGVSAKGPTCLSSYLAHGHSGYGWAARRRVLEKHGFYRANVLGNADLNIAQAMFGGEKYLKTDRLSPAAQQHLKTWANEFYESVQGSVTFVDGTLFHLWHGYKKNRLYHGRLEVLIEHDFDPEEDLAVSPEGPLVWASDKPALHEWCREYFAVREEDSV